MSRKRLGKREREARKSGKKARGSVWFVPKGGSEYVRLKYGKRKSAKVFRMLLKPVSKHPDCGRC